MAKTKQTKKEVQVQVAEANIAVKDESRLAKMNDAEATKIKNMATKSEQIRYMDSRGYSRSEIAKHLSQVYGKLVRYQHVRNVLITPLKRPDEKAGK